MQSFLAGDPEVHKIRAAVYVPVGSARRVHRNRVSHGIMYNCNECVKITFSDGNQLTVPQDAIAFLPQGSNYIVQNAENCGNSYAINFTLMTDETFEPFVLQTKDSKAFLDLFKKAERDWGIKKSGYVLKCKSILYSILYKMQKEYLANYTDSSKHALIRPAVSYIHEHYTTEQLKITRLAEMCSISPEYFRSIFQQFYGISPVKYINQLKIEHAAELLSSGLYSVTEVATLSGYNDPSHFSREFKKTYGISPTEY
jgi:AraC-like DNA-binding protein